MQFDAEKYYSAQKIISDAGEFINETNKALNDMEGTGVLPWSTDFEYEDELEDILFDISCLASDCTTIDNRLTNGLENTIILYPKYAQDYYYAVNSDPNSINYSEMTTYFNEAIEKEFGTELLNDLTDEQLKIYISMHNEDYANLSEEQKQALFDEYKSNILEYKNANIIKKGFDRTLATGANIAASGTEGILKIAEGGSDLVILGVGALFTPGELLKDAYKYGKAKIYGGEYKSGTKSLWAEKVLPKVAVDKTDSIMSGYYNNTRLGRWSDLMSADITRRGNFGYDLIEKTTEVTGTVVVSNYVQGAVANYLGHSFNAVAAATAPTVQTVSTYVAGGLQLSESVQDNYNTKKDEYVAKGKDIKNITGTEIFQIMNTSVSEAAIEGGIFGLTYGNGLKSYGVSTDSISINVGKKAMPSYVKKSIPKYVIKTPFTQEMLTKAELQYVKPWISNGVAWSGGFKNYDAVRDYAKESNRDGSINAVTSLLYDTYVSPTLKGIANNKIESFEPKITDISSSYDEASESFMEDLMNEEITRVKLDYLMLNYTDKAKIAIAKNIVSDEGKKIIGTAIKEGIKKPQKDIVEVINK